MRYPKSAGYKYSDVHLIIGKVLQNGNYEFMNSTCKADRDVYCKCELTVGKYIVFVEMDL